MKARLNYPEYFTTLPEYTAHAGQTVQVLRVLGPGEADPPDPGNSERMFKVRADDGWEGEAFASELDPEPVTFCRYEDCPEGNPVLPDDDPDEDYGTLTCPRCREDMGLPSLEQA